MQLLNETHHTMLLEFLNQDPYINLFLIGDLLLFGFDTEVQFFEGEFVDGKLVAVLFSFRDDSIHLYCKTISSKFIERVSELMANPSYKRLMMGKETHDLVAGRLDHLLSNKTPTTMALYNPIQMDLDIDQVLILDESFAQEIVQLQETSFQGPKIDPENIKKAIEKQETRYYGIVKDTKLVSVAAATAETDDSAMIIGVCTDIAYRDQKLASATMYRLSRDLHGMGKRAVLFYHDPAAKAVYDRLGYEAYQTYYMNDIIEKGPSQL